MSLNSKVILFFLSFALISCGDSKNSLMNNESSETQVWTSSSIKAELYLPTFAELENSQSPSPPVAVIQKVQATPEQLRELNTLEVERPFQFSNIICDAQSGYDVLYLVITDEDESTRNFTQDATCGFIFGEGFFQKKADGFISNQQICNFGMSFGVMGFLCSER